jgi:hypothetical protein
MNVLRGSLRVKVATPPSGRPRTTFVPLPASNFTGCLADPEEVAVMMTTSRWRPASRKGISIEGVLEL